ncbi:hypothetical protein SRHO_G00109310 [Serrasalmus rhombeus]
MRVRVAQLASRARARASPVRFILLILAHGRSADGNHTHTQPELILRAIHTYADLLAVDGTYHHGRFPSAQRRNDVLFQ